MITLPKLNQRALNRAIKHITNYPETYFQNDITKSCDVTPKTPCGAIGCLGGWLVLLNKPIEQRHDLSGAGGAWQEDYRIPEKSVILLGEHPDTAQSIAGLTKSESLYLFGGTPSDDPKKNVKTIKQRIAQIKRARIEVVKFNKMLGSQGGLDVSGHFQVITKDGAHIVYNV